MKKIFLEKNDIVDVILPATSCTSSEVQKIKKFLKEIDLQTNIFLEEKTVLKKAQTNEFPAFDAKTRFEQFKKAVENPNSKIIWCAKGGYGCAEILPFLQKMKKPKTTKIFIGFSDISALNKILIQDWGWEVITAPMLCQIINEQVSKKSIKAIVDLIFQKTKKLSYKLNPLTTNNQQLTTTITGGCLSVLVNNFGTKNQIDWKNKILFLEDEGETGERLDRYFHQIITISIEQKKFPSAVILGNFLQANPHGTPKAKNIKIAIERFATKLEELQIPLFEEKSKSLGHSKNMLPIILGKKVEINSSGDFLQKI